MVPRQFHGTSNTIRQARYLLKCQCTLTVPSMLVSSCQPFEYEGSRWWSFYTSRSKTLRSHGQLLLVISSTVMLALRHFTAELRPILRQRMTKSGMNWHLCISHDVMKTKFVCIKC